jgi:predicted outer membrane repeat protein
MRWKKVFLANKSRKVGGAILVSDRTDGKTNSNKR